MTDDLLIKKTISGDEHAFKELVKKYEPLVAATVIGMLGNCPEADDVGQETFIRFYKSLQTFRGESSVGTFLTRIAINLSLNELKRRRRKASLFPKSFLEIQNVNDECENYESNDIEDAVKKAIQNLVQMLQLLMCL